MRKPFLTCVPNLPVDIHKQFTPLPLLDSREFQQRHDEVRLKKGTTRYAAIYYLSCFQLLDQLSSLLLLAENAIVSNLSSQLTGTFVSELGDVVVLSDTKFDGTAKKVEDLIRDLLVENTSILPSDVTKMTGESLLEVFDLHQEMKKFDHELTRILLAEKEFLTPRGPEKWIRTGDNKNYDMSLIKLKELEDKVSKSDLSRFVRAQLLCQIDKRGKPQQTNREVYVSISDVQEILVPGIGIYTNPFLFRYLTQIFDKVVLRHLVKIGTPSSFSNLNINLNVANLYSDEFLAFLDYVEEKNFKSIVIEVQKADVFTDIGTFLYIKNSLQAKGIKFCLDAMTLNTLKYININEFSFDYIKLYWSPDMVFQDAAKILKKIKAEIILAHCESEDALTWGRENSIKLYQGWHVDKLLMPGSGKLKTPKKGSKKNDD